MSEVPRFLCRTCWRIQSHPRVLGPVNFLTILHLARSGWELPIQNWIRPGGVLEEPLAELAGNYVRQTSIDHAFLSDSPEFQTSALSLKRRRKTKGQDAVEVRISDELLRMIAPYFVEVVCNSGVLLEAAAVQTLAMLILRERKKTTFQKQFFAALNDEGFTSLRPTWECDKKIVAKLEKELPGMVMEIVIFTKIGEVCNCA